MNFQEMNEMLPAPYNKEKLFSLWLKKRSCKRRYTIDLTEFDSTFVSVPILVKMDFTRLVSEFLFEQGIDNVVQCFLEENYLLVGEKYLLDKKVLLLFSYKERLKYIHPLLKINELVSDCGVCEVFVNNDVYDLSAGLLVHTSENFEEILEIAKQSGMKMVWEQGIEEKIREMSYGQRAMFPLFHEITEEMLVCLFGLTFSYPPLEREYNSGRKKFVKSKVFVSYCHKDKEKVLSIVEELKHFGLNIWIDYQEIDYGKNILHEISNGLTECDLALVFLSRNTLQARYANYELVSIFDEIIRQVNKRDWVPVRLDEVDPSEIYVGLGVYKYFDCSEGTEKLYEIVQKKIDNRNAEKSD